jgi:hypothetical protein
MIRPGLPRGLAHGLPPNLVHSEKLTVAERHTVPHVAPDWPGFADMPPVLATAMMIGFVEQINGGQPPAASNVTRPLPPHRSEYRHP